MHQLPPYFRLVQLWAQVRVIRVVERFRSPGYGTEGVSGRSERSRDSRQDPGLDPGLHGGVGREDSGGGRRAHLAACATAHPHRHAACNTIHTTALPSIAITSWTTYSTSIRNFKNVEVDNSVSMFLYSHSSLTTCINLLVFGQILGPNVSLLDAMNVGLRIFFGQHQVTKVLRY